MAQNGQSRSTNATLARALTGNSNRRKWVRGICCFDSAVLAVTLFLAGCTDEEVTDAKLDGGPCTVQCADAEIPTADGRIPGAQDDAHAADSMAVNPGDETDAAPPTASDPLAADLTCGQPAPDAGVLLVPGHQTPIQLVHRWEDRILSQDDSQHWILWDARTGRQISQGLSNVRARQELFITDDGELRAMLDGSVLNTVPIGAQLSDNAQYLWGFGGEGLVIWSRSGAPLASFSGAYRYEPGLIVATPSGVRIAKGPAGATVIETLGLDGSRTTSSPFTGEFLAWFADGGRFFTRASGDLIRVYSGAGVQEAAFLSGAAPGTTIQGWGDYYWYQSKSDVLLFKVGSSEPIKAPSDGAISIYSTGLLETTSTDALHVADLKIAAPEFVRQPAVSTSRGRTIQVRGLATGAGLEEGSSPDSFTTQTLLYSSSRRNADDKLIPLGCGATIGVVASKAGRAVVASADLRLRVYDLPSTSPTYVADFAFSSPDPKQKINPELRNSTLDLTNDGVWLIVGDRRSTVAYRLAADAASEIWRKDRQDGFEDSFALARDSARLLIQSCNLVARSCTRTTISLPDMTTYPSPTSLGQDIEVASYPSISPSGAHVALSVVKLGSEDTATYFFEGSTIQNTAAMTIQAGWLSETQLLVHRYRRVSLSSFHRYQDSAVLSPNGTQLAAFALTSEAVNLDFAGEAFPCRARNIDEDQFYCLQTGRIHSSKMGSVVWTGQGVEGDVAGDYALQIMPMAEISTTKWR